MRVLLLHNPTAGDEEHDREALVEALEGSDHDVSYQSTRRKGWKDSLDASVDVFVAAGGDGTVRRVAGSSGDGARRRVTGSSDARPGQPCACASVCSPA